MSRRSRSRTPSRVSTPIVKSAPAKSKTTKKKAPTTRGRSKTPTRITTSTPKPPKSPAKAKSSPTKKTPAKAKKTPSKKAVSKKRKIIDISDSDHEDDVDYHVSPAKKTKSPSGAPSTKAVGRPKKSPNLNEAGSSGKVRRSRRVRESTLNSIVEESSTSKGSSKDFSVNGGVNQSRNESTTEAQQAGKWGWFNCAIM